MNPSSAIDRPAVLTPGDYLLELETAKAVSQNLVLMALHNAGFRDFHVDPGFKRTPDPRPQILGRREDEENNRTRIVSTLVEHAQIAHIPGKVRWTLVHRLRVNPRMERATKIGGLSDGRPLSLATGTTYESRLLTRNKPDFPTMERVWTELRKMGHEPLKLVEMKRQMRLPQQPGGLWSEWLSWTRWLGNTGNYVQQPSIVFDEIVSL